MSSGTERDILSGEITIKDPCKMSFKEKAEQYFRATKGAIIHGTVYIAQELVRGAELLTAPEGILERNGKIVTRGIVLRSGILNDKGLIYGPNTFRGDKIHTFKGEIKRK